MIWFTAAACWCKCIRLSALLLKVKGVAGRQVRAKYVTDWLRRYWPQVCCDMQVRTLVDTDPCSQSHVVCVILIASWLTSQQSTVHWSMLINTVCVPDLRFCCHNDVGTQKSNIFTVLLQHSSDLQHSCSAYVGFGETFCSHLQGRYRTALCQHKFTMWILLAVCLWPVEPSAQVLLQCFREDGVFCCSALGRTECSAAVF